MFYKRTSVLFLVSVLILPVAIQSIEFKCKSEGRFGISSDCGSFVDCVRRNESGVLEPRKGSCGKGGFHPKEKRCVSLKKLKGCSNRRARLDLKRHDLNHLCSGGSDFVCADCNTLVHCLDGVAFAQSCAPGDLCQVKETFGGAVCYPEWLPNCSCERSNIFRKDPYDERTFYFCDNYALPTFYKCSEEMLFDLNIEQCVNEHGLPPCTKIGVFADHDDCRNYYTCIQSERGWVQKLFTCPGLTMYSEVNSKCEDPCKWYKGAFECKEEGRFRDKTNCQTFYECISTEDGFRQTKRLCPSGFFWEQIGNSNTGNCISKENSQCSALTPTSCDVPPDWCEFDVGSKPFPDFEDQIDYDYAIDYVGVKTSNNQTETPIDSNNTGNNDSLIIMNKDDQGTKKIILTASPFLSSLSNINDELKNNAEKIVGHLLNSNNKDQYNFKINANKYVVLRGNNKNAGNSFLETVNDKNINNNNNDPLNDNDFADEVNMNENDDKENINLTNNEKENIKEKLESSKYNIHDSENEENIQNEEVYIPIVIRNKDQTNDNTVDNEGIENVVILEDENAFDKEVEKESEDNVPFTNNANDYQVGTSYETNTFLPVVEESTTSISETNVDTNTDGIDKTIFEDTSNNGILEIESNDQIQETNTPTESDTVTDDENKYLHGHGYFDKTDNEDLPSIFSAYGESLNFGSSEDFDESLTLLDSQNHSESSAVTTLDYREIESVTEDYDDSFVVSTTNSNLNENDDLINAQTTIITYLISNDDTEYTTMTTTTPQEKSENSTSNIPDLITDKDNFSSTQKETADEQSSSQPTESTDLIANGDAAFDTALDHERSLEEDPHIYTFGDEVPNLNRIIF